MAESVTPRTVLGERFKRADVDAVLRMLGRAGFRIVPPGWDVVKLEEIDCYDYHDFPDEARLVRERFDG